MTRDYGAVDSARPSTWRGLAGQLGLTLAVCGMITLAAEALNLRADTAIGAGLRLCLPFLPPCLWLLWGARRSVRRERLRLWLGVALLSALLASSIGNPLMRDVFAADEWLPLESVFRRIIGFALTAGALDAGLKLLSLHLIVDPNGLTRRDELLSLAFASAIGYSFLLNIEALWQGNLLPGMSAIVVLANLAIQVTSAMFIALGLIESAFADARPHALPLSVMAAAVTTGLISALYQGVMSGPLGLAGNSDRPFFGFAVLGTLLIVALMVLYFLFSASQRRAREAFRGESQTTAGEGYSGTTPRQRWSLAFSALAIGLSLLLGLALRDASLGQSRVYNNVEAGIQAHYPYRWLLDESGDYVFRVRDTVRRGFPTIIEVSALPVGPETTERNLLDRLTLSRAQTLIDYAVLGYDIYLLPDESAAVSMAYSFVSRDTSPFLEGASSIVAGLDILSIRRGQAVIVSFRADAAIFERELATLRWFMDNLES